MQIRILGTGSGLPELGKHLSSVHVQSEGKQYLLDCGEGTIYQLLRYEIGKEDLDAVLISHYHPDHVAGIFMLIQSLYLQGRSRQLLLFLPEREREFAGLFSLFYTFVQRIGFQLKILPMSSVSQHLPCIQALANDHLLGYSGEISKHGYQNQMMAYSLRVNSPDGDFVYSSDIATTDSIVPLLQGAHTLLVDAGHPELAQIKKLPEHGLKRILLTHGVPRSSLLQLLMHRDTIFEEALEGTIYRLDAGTI